MVRIAVLGAGHIAGIMKEIECPKQITGYEYEVESCIEAIEKRWIECPLMPHEETIRMMDSLRQSWGITYPGE